MPWEIRKDTEGCDGWAVVKKGGDKVEGCHKSRAQATEQIKALYANEGTKESMALEAQGPARFEGMVHLEEKPTDDGRVIDANAIESREPPIPLMWTDITGDGHYGAKLAGTITSVERSGNEIRIEGSFATTESGEQLRDALSQGLPLRPSIDLAHDPEEVEFSEDRDGKQVARIKKGKLIGVTLVPIPAQEGTWLREITEEAQEEAKALAASVGNLPDPLPAEWFEDPGLEVPTPLTVTPEGRVFGHAFLWEECHTGHLNTCVRPPNSVTDYSYFRIGSVNTTKGTQPVGPLTLSGGHAGLKMDAKSAMAHYDDTKSAVADVNFGEDEVGGWFAGALRPGVTPEQIRVLQASAISGDWRPVKEGLELIALLSVNTPGFPVRRVLVASGEVQAMVVGASSFAVTPFTNLALVSDRDRAFDGLAADKRIRKWASSDGSGARDKINWNKYAKAHFWYDPSNPDKWASYKFLYADIDNGELKAVPRAVFAVAQALQGARGGFKGVPEADVKKIKTNVEKYYTKIAAMEGSRDLKPPWDPDSEARTHGKKREMKSEGKEEQALAATAMSLEDLDRIIERPEVENTIKELDALVLSESVEA